MKKIICILILISGSFLFASLDDYQEEFGFPLDKPRHGKYYFLKELLSIEQDPQIMIYKPALNDQMRISLIENAPETELDQVSLSDTTLVVNTDALNDLDMFESLKLESDLIEKSEFSISDSVFSFTKAEPADYNLYTKMEVPELITKETGSISFIPVTNQSKAELKTIAAKIQDLSYQIDNIYRQENLILPQSGSINFILLITEEGIIQVDYRITGGNGFSKSFISKCQDTIKRWQITSQTKLQYILSRNYLKLP